MPRVAADGGVDGRFGWIVHSPSRSRCSLTSVCVVPRVDSRGWTWWRFVGRAKDWHREYGKAARGNSQRESGATRFGPRWGNTGRLVVNRAHTVLRCCAPGAACVDLLLVPAVYRWVALMAHATALMAHATNVVKRTTCFDIDHRQGRCAWTTVDGWPLSTDVRLNRVLPLRLDVGLLHRTSGSRNARERHSSPSKGRAHLCGETMATGTTGAGYVEVGAAHFTLGGLP